MRAGRYTAGVATHYPASRLTGGVERQDLAAGFTVGMRFHSAPVTRLADCKRIELGHTATADGRWRLYAFAGADETLWRETLEWLASAEVSPLARHAAAGGDIGGLVDVRGTIQRAAHEAELAEMPALLRPVTGPLGLVDYEKAFTATRTPGASEQDIFAVRGIDRAAGAMVLVRPDQYVAQALPLDATDRVRDFPAQALG